MDCRQTFDDIGHSMSLINQMLKDLERKQQQLDSRGQQALQGLFATSGKTMLPSAKTWLALSLCLFSIAAIVWVVKSTPEVPAKETTPAPAIVATPQVPLTPLAEKFEPVIEYQTTQQTQLAPPPSIESAPVRQGKQEKQQRFESINQLLSQERYPEAQQALAELIEAYPDYLLPRMTLSKLFIKRGELDKAQQVLQAALKHYPKNLSLTVLHIRVLIEQGKSEQALAQINQAKQYHPNTAELNALRAVIYTQNEQPKLAAQIYQQLIVQQPHVGDWWVGLAITLEELTKPNEAMAAYQRGLESPRLKPQLQVYATNRLNQLKG